MSDEEKKGSGREKMMDEKIEVILSQDLSLLICSITLSFTELRFLVLRWVVEGRDKNLRKRT